jgi:sulfur-carrier protein
MAEVSLFANLRLVAGIKKASIKGNTISEIIDALIAQYPALDSHLLQDGKLRPHIIITINGHPTTELQTPVADQDEIAIFPPITGG